MTARTVLEFICNGPRCARLAYASCGQLPRGWCWVGLAASQKDDLTAPVLNYCPQCQKERGMVKGRRAGEMMEAKTCSAPE